MTHYVIGESTAGLPVVLATTPDRTTAEQQRAAFAALEGYTSIRVEADYWSGRERERERGAP